MRDIIFFSAVIVLAFLGCGSDDYVAPPFQTKLIVEDVSSGPDVPREQDAAGTLDVGAAPDISAKADPGMVASGGTDRGDTPADRGAASSCIPAECETDGQHMCFHGECLVPPVVIELTWSTPEDPDPTDGGQGAGTDLDLHFTHPNAPSNPDAKDQDGDGKPDPYFDETYDCCSTNPKPDWGAKGDNSDDPHLVRDDTDGWGPEVLAFDPGGNTENGRYEVAVHYFKEHGFGHSFATVRVYLHGELAFEASEVQLQGADLWCVAFLDWPTREVTSCATDGVPRISTDVEHPAIDF